MNFPIQRVAVYLRVSTEKQEGNTSKENQLYFIERYIEDNKLQISEKFIYEDCYSASRNPKSTDINDDKISSRPELNRLIFDAKLKKFDTVFVYSHDRLTRNVRESLLLKYLFEKLKINVIYCRPGEKLSSENEKFNQFFENLLNNLSQLESNLIASRVKLGTQYNVENKFWPGGPPPYGYRLVKVPGEKKEKSMLEVVYSEARIVIEIFQLYRLGNTPENIAQIIRNKYPNNTDRKWTKNSIKSILANEDYTGTIVWDKKGGARNPIKHSNRIRSTNSHESIISNELWMETQKIKLIQKNKPRYLTTKFLFRDFLRCGYCGNILKTKNNGGTKGRVYYCKKEERKWELCVNADEIESKIVNNIGELLTNSLSEEKADFLFEQYLSKIKAQKELYNKQVNEIEEEIKNANKYLIECEKEIHILENLRKVSDKQRIFIESLKEFKSYLNINIAALEANKEEANKGYSKAIPDKEAFKKFLAEKKTLLDAFQGAPNEKSYLRGMRTLFYDLIDKIIVSKNEKKTELEIILK